MAKRVRRVRKSRAKTLETTASETADSGKPLSIAEQFQLEYAYVLKDLRFVFILAAIMFLILIALNLVLQ